MFDLIHNKVNSIYFIINIKLNFPDLLNSDIDDNYINLKKKYKIVIEKWIKNILDQYSLMSNWVIYIANFNFNTFRIFIYLNSVNYTNMDDKNLIYLSDMINYETMFKLNINDFSKLFHIDKLNLLIDLELGLIKNNLDDSSNDESNNESNDSSNDESNNSSFDESTEDYNVLSDDESYINLLINNSNNNPNNNSTNLKETNFKKINTFNIIDFNYFSKKSII